MLKAKYEMGLCYTHLRDTLFAFNQVKKLSLAVIDVDMQPYPPALTVSGIKRVRKKILRCCRKELIQDQGLEYLVFSTVRGGWNIEIYVSYLPFPEIEDIRYQCWNLVPKDEFEKLKGGKHESFTSTK